MTESKLDTLVVGAGFGGIYQLYSLLQLGLSVRVIDFASDVGGTWYWNRYPGAMSDTESFIYRFTWDKEDLQTYPWARHYLKQSDVLKYLEHVVERHGLRRYMRFKTEMTAATWDERENVWRVQVNADGKEEVYVVKYLVTALGLLSKKVYPDIPHIEDFKGEICHTAAWRPDIELSGKDVAIIGNGSTGIQVITEIAGKVKSLTSFQRRPQYTVPSGDGPVSEEYRKDINSRYDGINAQVQRSICAFGFVKATRPYDSFTPEEQEKIFEWLWQKGNGFRFMFGGFSDIATNPVANEAACNFIRKKISQIVKDPEKARKLMPWDRYARRPLCDGGYYEQFNRENVDIVDIKETPITRFTERGILTQEGKEHKFDVIILATGFDAIDGNYDRLHIRGLGGRTLRDHWKNGPTAYLGFAVPYFPNMFMVTGPQGPFTNLPPALEAHVRFITGMIERAERDRKEGGQGIIEATPEAEREWVKLCKRFAEGSLFKDTASWIFGNNVPGKTQAVRFFFGGMRAFNKALQNEADAGYTGFMPLTGGQYRVDYPSRAKL